MIVLRLVVFFEETSGTMSRGFFSFKGKSKLLIDVRNLYFCIPKRGLKKWMILSGT
jgi:hypothetical protein